MESKKITYRFTDTGRWLARCNHDTGVIELNRREYPNLSPLLRDYVWVHECVHLLCNVYNEEECDRIASEIFVCRATSAADRRRREQFVAASRDGGNSHIAATAVAGLIVSAVNLGVKIYNYYQTAQDKGWYSLSASERSQLLDGLIKASFEKAKEGGVSAQQVFWANIRQCPGVESSYNAFISNPDNYLVRGYITKYAAQYGFAFDKVLPVDYLSQPLVKYGLIALAALALILVLSKKLKK